MGYISLNSILDCMIFKKIFFKTDDNLSVASTTLFSWFFRGNFLCLKLILAFCLLHIFALELTLQEVFVRTDEFRRK